MNVASWTSRSASCASTSTAWHGAVSPEMTIRRPGRVSPITCSERTPLTVSPRCRRPKSGPSVTPERPRGLDVEAPRPVVLDERVAVRLDAVVDRERRDQERAEADLLVGLELGELERVAGPADHRPHRPEQRAQAGRPVDRQRPLARAQVERLEHPEQAEPVVEMEVRDEHRADVGQPDRAQQLLLGALAAVEEDPLAAGAQQQRGQPAARGGNRSGRAGEEQRQVHAWTEVSAGRRRAARAA